MNINEMTIGQARELTELLTRSASPSHSMTVGAAVIVRTVTYHYTGRIVAITDSDIVLDDAAWVADSGRWGQALATGTLAEVEPYPGRCIVSRAAIVDMTEWPHALPRVAQ